MTRGVSINNYDGRLWFIAFSMVSVYHTDAMPHISESRLSQPAQMTMPKRTTHNLIVSIGKS